MVRNMITVLADFMNERMFDELRTKQQLGYSVGVGHRKTCGVYGIKLYVQSAEHSPIFLEAKILEFIDNFYFDMLKPESFENYRRGTLNFMKTGFRGIQDEAQYLYERLTHFSLDPGRECGWDDKQEEINFIEKITFDEI